jgi:hypothetical protein
MKLPVRSDPAMRPILLEFAPSEHRFLVLAMDY